MMAKKKAIKKRTKSGSSYSKRGFRNYGFNLQKQQEELSDKDHVFGGLSKSCLTNILPEERELYLPKGEIQNLGEEKYDCVSRAILNKLEVKLNWLDKNGKLLDRVWFIKNGYLTVNGFELSDAFTAIKSGTTREGNSLKAPLESVRKDGIIPKSMCPQLETWEAHHDPKRITARMEKLGKEFAERITIKYEKVYEQDYINLIQKDMLIVAGFAWEEPQNGEYGRVDYDPNHSFIIYKPLFYAFDNYIDLDRDFIKKLSRDYNFLDYGYRVYILSQQILQKKGSFWQIIKDWLMEILK